MKLNTVLRRTYTADLLEPFAIPGEGGTQAYRFVKTVECHVIPVRPLGWVRLQTTELYKRNHRFANIRTKDGDIVFPGDNLDTKVFNIFSITPVLTPFGSVEGYDYFLKGVGV